jgi:hypothetical protein
MAGEKSYVVEMVSGCKITKRRGLSFLICENDESIDAKMAFDRLGQETDRKLRSRFDHWIDGGRPNKKWFHSWDESKNRHCFVFKWNEGSQGHRLYGFLCHPSPLYSSFQLCVLFSHATKNQWETNPRELKKANELRKDDAVIKAIIKATKDLKSGEKK